MLYILLVHCQIHCSMTILHAYIVCYYTVWLQTFDRENFCEKPTFCINRNFWNKIFVNSYHFRDTIMIDYAVIDTSSSSVPGKTFQLTSCIRGFHVYESAWTPTHHESLYCSRVEENVHDPYAVKVAKLGIVVGHLPKKISVTCFLFLRKGVGSHAKLRMRCDSV